MPHNLFLKRHPVFAFHRRVPQLRLAFERLFKRTRLHVDAATTHQFLHKSLSLTGIYQDERHLAAAERGRSTQPKPVIVGYGDVALPLRAGKAAVVTVLAIAHGPVIAKLIGVAVLSALGVEFPPYVI